MDMLSNTNIQFYILAYLVGSIPFGLIIAKYFAGVDIKKEGSGNIGATNVLRVLKQRDPKKAKKLAAATLALDAIKGVVVLLLGSVAGAPQETMWAIAVLAVIGHCFSIFLMGEGGKGVATGLGVLLYMLPFAALVGLVVWMVAAKLLKISSLSSLLGVLGAVGSSFLIYPDIPHAPVVIIGLIILYKHTDNIIRLITGEEKAIV
ncbi:MAG: acyl-phosphate--glycerol-3-phosphate O-acyltransferase [Campylobacteraceae bacterium 4484_4]|nr:MAG: acyl-phosphate--glycerol-3-phosphate O-acyltransferase [Campylobacteraceae bacterium 4484_4]